MPTATPCDSSSTKTANILAAGAPPGQIVITGPGGSTTTISPAQLALLLSSAELFGGDWTSVAPYITNTVVRHRDATFIATGTTLTTDEPGANSFRDIEPTGWIADGVYVDVPLDHNNPDMTFNAANNGNGLVFAINVTTPGDFTVTFDDAGGNTTDLVEFAVVWKKGDEGPAQHLFSEGYYSGGGFPHSLPTWTLSSAGIYYIAIVYQANNGLTALPFKAKFKVDGSGGIVIGSSIPTSWKTISRSPTWQYINFVNGLVGVDYYNYYGVSANPSYLADQVDQTGATPINFSADPAQRNSSFYLNADPAAVIGNVLTLQLLASGVGTYPFEFILAGDGTFDWSTVEIQFAVVASGGFMATEGGVTDNADPVSSSFFMGPKPTESIIIRGVVDATAITITGITGTGRRAARPRRVVQDLFADVANTTVSADEDLVTIALGNIDAQSGGGGSQAGPVKWRGEFFGLFADSTSTKQLKLFLDEYDPSLASSTQFFDSGAMSTSGPGIWKLTFTIIRSGPLEFRCTAELVLTNAITATPIGYAVATWVTGSSDLPVIRLVGNADGAGVSVGDITVTMGHIDFIPQATPA